MHKIIIDNLTALIFGRLVLDSMSINVCHIYNFEFVCENINIFLLDDHIWNYVSKFKRSYLPNLLSLPGHYRVIDEALLAETTY